MASKGSKWAKIKSQFPKIALDGDYASKIDAVRNSPMPQLDIENGVFETCPREEGLRTEVEIVLDTPLRALEFTTVVKVYNLYRDKKEELENELSTINLKIEAVEAGIEEHYEAHDLLTQKFDDGSSLTVSPDPVVTVADDTAFYAWVKADPERVSRFKLAEYINPQTTKSGIKELLEKDVKAALPPGVEVFYQNKLTRRSG